MKSLHPLPLRDGEARHHTGPITRRSPVRVRLPHPATTRPSAVLAAMLGSRQKWRGFSSSLNEKPGSWWPGPLLRKIQARKPGTARTPPETLSVQQNPFQPSASRTVDPKAERSGDDSEDSHHITHASTTAAHLERSTHSAPQRARQPRTSTWMNPRLG